MKIEIKKFINHNGNKLVGFCLTTEKGAIFIIDKEVPLENGKTDEQYVQAALAMAQNEIDEWKNSQSLIGKTWNPETNSFN